MFSFLGSDVDSEPDTSSPSAVPSQDQLPVTEQEQHVCETCGVRCESEEALLQHDVLHDWEKCHMCTVCRWHCKCHSDMITHIQTHTTSNEQHTEDLYTVMFYCFQCQKLDMKRSKLRLHYSVHPKG